MIDGDRDNILIAYLPQGQYVGLKLFQSRPSSFKNENAKLQWDKQSAANAIILKQQLERGQITAQSVLGQLVMDLNLTDEEKATLDKERETEEKKSRVQFLKTEMKLIELDAKIKTCLCLEKADTELCLKLLDELMELEVKPLMLLKHATCLETVKRMRAYVGNTPSWDLSENAILLFSQQALLIRKKADTMYGRMKGLFTIPEGLIFWEFFMERVAQFKKVTTKLSSDELLELVHEPLEMSTPAAHTMRAAIDAVNDEEILDEPGQKTKPGASKAKKSVNNTPTKQAVKRQNLKKQDENNIKEKEEKINKDKEEKDNKDKEEKDNKDKEQNNSKDKDDKNSKEKDEKVSKGKDEIKIKEKDEKNSKEKEVKNSKEKEVKINKEKETKNSKEKEEKNSEENPDEKVTEVNNKDEDLEETKQEKDKVVESTDEKAKESEKNATSTEEAEQNSESKDKKNENKEESLQDSEEKAEKSTDNSEQSEKVEEKVKEKEKEKQDDEPKAKRSRESKKTEPPPPRSPMKRKSKA